MDRAPGSPPLALTAGSGGSPREGPAPVEYAVAVEEYLAQAALSAASQRVYRISLTGWAWPLAGKAIPAGRGRRSAAPPVVPLALLDDPDAAGRLAAAAAERAAATDPRTVNREISALRSAVGWWQEQRWIAADPTEGLRLLRPGPAAAPALTAAQVSALWRRPVGLREHALWRLIHDTGAPPGEVLALNADQLDLTGHRVRHRPAADSPLIWSEPTSQILRWLVAGRTYGPVFLTDRKAPARADAADVCPVTGRGRMSYRRAEEIFTVLTRPLDPAGRGWTLHQLQRAPHSRGEASRMP
ncbi:MAG TPA: site-specific recombinase [Streptosporangiaceae bacterium]|jgi:integrase/recombinase XerD